LWVRAIDTYDKISKIVEPKKLKLKKAELTVKHNLKQLELRRKALQVGLQRAKLMLEFTGRDGATSRLKRPIFSNEPEETRSAKPNYRL
jgi:hypothetical protein